ncbi:MAG: arsenite efflux transporter metallochaperone ArsD [Dehalococcoidia bacterium]|nr:arsenite efflux transporter metallochaperone ArsD [Dehalococcoidia bacterium]
MNHKNISIFEGAMCCDTGVCGTEPDITLIEFASTLRKLKQEYPELEILRANMTTGLNIFRKNMDVMMLVKIKGVSILPLVLIDGKVFSEKNYPQYEELKKALES